MNTKKAVVHRRSEPRPKILGTSTQESCDFCGSREQAEYFVRLFAPYDATREPGHPGHWDFDLCGTCLARETKCGSFPDGGTEFLETYRKHKS